MTPEQALQVKALRTRSDRSEIFNYVIDHLRKQGERVAARWRCTPIRAYRSSEGTMCAVGALITDDEHQFRWEGQGIDNLLKQSDLPPTLHKCLTQHESMLLELQTFHDGRLVYERGVFSKDSEDRVADLRKKWDIQ